MKKVLTVNRGRYTNVQYILQTNKVLGNSVPAAAVKQRGQALNMMTGRKGCVDGYYSENLVGMFAYRRNLSFVQFIFEIYVS